MNLVLFQPEIPQNAGTLLRLGACLNVPVDIIEPCGFVWSATKLKRAGMDYLDLAQATLFSSWQNFQETRSAQGRLVLLTPRASQSYLDFLFEPQDFLILGRESNGVPPEVRQEIPYHLSIPMQPPCRSLNVAIATALVLGEALRQTQLFPSFAQGDQE